MMRMGVFDHTRPAEPKSGTANASGVASLFYGPCPEGYGWYIERISVHCPTAAAVAHVCVALTPLSAVDYGSRMDFTTGGADSIADESTAIYVPAGYSLSIIWTAATSADVCTASVQYAVHQLDPRYMMSPEDMREVQAAHEHPKSPLTHPAVAGERAI